jgi:hypothetical protein
MSPSGDDTFPVSHSTAAGEVELTIGGKYQDLVLLTDGPGLHRLISSATSALAALTACPQETEEAAG